MSIYRPGVYVAFCGQSFVNYPTTGNDAIPGKVMAGRSNPWDNLAVTGASWTNLQPVAVDLVYRPARPYEKAVLVMCGGNHDILDNDTAATAMADTVTFADGARPYYDYIIACTIPPSTAYSGADETQRQAYNPLLIADAGDDFDAVFDLAAIPELADPNNVTYYADGSHPTAAAATIVAAGLSPAVTSALAAV